MLGLGDYESSDEENLKDTAPVKVRVSECCSELGAKSADVY